MSEAAAGNLDKRKAARHRADFRTIMERSAGGEHFAHICNVSANGFMIDDAKGVERGDRVSVKLPVIGRIEAHCMWTVDTRAGFQLERILRTPDFLAMLDELQIQA